MTEDLSRGELHAAVDHAVEQLLADAGVTAPPVDVVALAQGHLGMTIRVEDRPRRRAVRPNKDREIVLPAGLSVEQTQWAVARALGAIAKPDLLLRLGVPAEEQKGLTGASLAEMYATHLLLPTRWFASEARALGFDVAALHKVFTTASAEMVAWRLLDLDEPCVITVVDNGAVVRRRSNAWHVNRTLSPPEQECQHEVHHNHRPHVVRSSGWIVQGWPVDGAEGRREILRSERGEV